MSDAGPWKGRKGSSVSVSVRRGSLGLTKADADGGAGAGVEGVTNGLKGVELGSGEDKEVTLVLKEEGKGEVVKA